MNREIYGEENFKNRVSKQFYIDRSGKAIKYEGGYDEDMASLHYHIAKGLYPRLDHPEDALMRLGYVLIGSTVYNHPIIDKKPTQAQLNRLDKLGLLDRLTFLYDKKYVDYNKYSILQMY